MQIFATGSCTEKINPYAGQAIYEFRKSASLDRIALHKPTDDPKAADIIIFADNHMNPDWRVRAMLEHPLMRQYPEKCMVHEERPIALGLLPGVYVSMPKKFFDPRSQRAWCYFKLPEGAPVNPQAKPSHLYSFRGQVGQRISPAYRLRRRLLELSDRRAVIQHVTNFSPYAGGTSKADTAEKQARYARTLEESKFILSPRGYATSSFRCYEAMRAGRVPVILADEWVPPAGPDWEKCAIFIPENQVKQIPEILRTAEPKWEAMATEALRAFNTYFAPDVNWHNLMEQFRILKECNPKVDPKLIARRTRDVARTQFVSQIWGKAAETATRLKLKK